MFTGLVVLAKCCEDFKFSVFGVWVDNGVELFVGYSYSMMFVCILFRLVENLFCVSFSINCRFVFVKKD